MYYTVIKHSGHLRTLEKCRKHSPAARVFYISLVFSNNHRVLSQFITRLRQSEGQELKSTNQNALLPVQYSLSIGPGIVPNDPALVFAFFSRVINLLLLGTVLGEYRPSVFFVRTELRSVRTVKTSGRYSPSTVPSNKRFILYNGYRTILPCF